MWGGGLVMCVGDGWWISGYVERWGGGYVGMKGATPRRGVWRLFLLGWTAATGVPDLAVSQIGMWPLFEGGAQW